MSDGFLSDRAVAALLDVTRQAVWTLARRGTFPLPYKLSGMRATRWRRSEIEAWIRSQQLRDLDAEDPSQAAIRRKRAAAKAARADVAA